MNPVKVLEILAELRVLRFFPNDEVVHERHCQALRLDVRQRGTSPLVSESHDQRHLRGVAGDRGDACMFLRPVRPADGINAYSTVFLDGLPPDPTAPPRIAAPVLKALPPGNQ